MNFKQWFHSIFKNRITDCSDGRDERNKEYSVSDIILGASPITRYWNCCANLDQGKEGMCAGFATVHEIISDPVPLKLTKANGEDLARRCYNWAQIHDEWKGEAYSGTSVNAVMKWSKSRGYIESYHWAFGIDDLILAVCHKGPAVLGISWYDGMHKPKGGFIKPTDKKTGRHAILCNGYNAETEVFTLHNSWGRRWGYKGECFITKDDMERLLDEQGVAAIPTGRKALNTKREGA